MGHRLNDILNYGPDYAKNRFCDDFAVIYDPYALIYTGDENYKAIIAERAAALPAVRVRIAQGLATEADYQNLKSYYEQRLNEIFYNLETSEYLFQAIINAKYSMNEILRNKPDVSIQLHGYVCNLLRLPPDWVVYPFTYYEQMAICIKQLKATVTSSLQK